MTAIITLTTDFGLTDAYVAAMKGVILSINHEAKLVDICHTVRPQNIEEAAFVLGTAYQLFPTGTIHLVVVDPGVGTERRAIILKTPSAYFVAPDNGVLSYVIQDYPGRQEGLPKELKAVSITNPRFWREPVSPTFHGRDIFAPVAAHLSLGTPIREFGKSITSLVRLPIPQSRREEDGSLVGQVSHIDSFGNLTTNIKSDRLPSGGQTVIVEIANQRINQLSRTYAKGKGLLALIGSSDYLEIALTGGSAAGFLHVKIGDEVKVKLKTKKKREVKRQK
jgi:S-adenosylmethionine hydrolase